jgi:hypothetical protein
VVPDLRSWPKRKPLVGTAMVLSALIGAAGVLVADSRSRMRQAAGTSADTTADEPAQASSLHEEVEIAA